MARSLGLYEVFCSPPLGRPHLTGKVEYKSHSYCCTPQCKSKCVKGVVSLHKFPSDPKVSEEWKVKLRIGKVITQRMLVCSLHFQESDFSRVRTGYDRFSCTLKRDAVPSQNLPVRPLDKTPRPPRRHLVRKSIVSAQETSVHPDSDSDHPDNADMVSNYTDSDRSDNEDGLNSSGEVNNVKVKFFQAGSLYRCSKTSADKSTQADLADILPYSFDVQFDEFLNDSGKLNTYTGLPSLDFLDVLEDEVRSFGVVKDSTLSVKQKIVLTMIRIKTNLTFEAIAILFHISAQSVSKCFKRLIPLLSAVLKPAIRWCSKSEIMSNMPKCFSKFQKTRVVLDCTEMSIEKPKCYQCRIRTYSHYKHGHTIKILVGVTPAGVINFVSDAYGGRASDKAIFEQSDLIGKLEPYVDAVMVDKGFQIDDACLLNNVELIRPPFLRSAKQFSERDALDNQAIASARVHVERIMQRIKLFKILSDIIDWDLLPYVNDIVQVICGIVNCSPPILAEQRFL